MKQSRGRNTVAWGLIALCVLLSPPEKATAISLENTVQHDVLEVRPRPCSLNVCPDSLEQPDARLSLPQNPDARLGLPQNPDARLGLLEPPFALLERLQKTPTLTPTLEYNGEDDPKKPKEPNKPEDPKKPSPPPPGGSTPRALDVPRRLTEIRRDLRIGQLWVAESAQRPSAVRVSLEVKEHVIGAITLDPENGQPVVYQERANYRPASTPESTQLTTMLQSVRAQTPEIKFGTFVLPSPRGLEIQVYLAAKLVSYVYLDPKSGDAVNDDGTVREIDSSSIRLR